MGLCRAYTCIRPRLVGCEDGKVFFVTREMYIIFTIQFHTQHYVSAVFANFHIISGDGIPHPFGPMLLLCFYGILVVSYVPSVMG